MAIIQKTENDSLTAGERKAIDRFLELDETNQLFDGNVTLYRVYRKRGIVNVRSVSVDDWHMCQALKEESGTNTTRLI